MSLLRRIAVLCLSISGIFGTIGPAHAQWEGNATYEYGQALGYNAWVQASIWDPMNRQMEAEREARQGGKPEPEERKPPKRVVSVGTDEKVSAEAKRRYLDVMRRQGGSRIAQQLDDYFRRTPIRTELASIAGPYGLSANDYGDVFTAYLVAMWMVANDERPPQENEVRGVREQVNALLLQGLPKGSRQEIQMQAEGMMYELVSAIAMRNHLTETKDFKARSRLADITERNFQRANHISLQSLGLFYKGFFRP